MTPANFFGAKMTRSLISVLVFLSSQQPQETAARNRNRRWPGGVVPYFIDNTFGEFSPKIWMLNCCFKKLGCNNGILKYMHQIEMYCWTSIRYHYFLHTSRVLWIFPVLCFVCKAVNWTLYKMEPNYFPFEPRLGFTWLNARKIQNGGRFYNSGFDIHCRFWSKEPYLSWYPEISPGNVHTMGTKDQSERLRPHCTETGVSLDLVSSL